MKYLKLFEDFTKDNYKKLQDTLNKIKKDDEFADFKSLGYIDDIKNIVEESNNIEDLTLKINSFIENDKKIKNPQLANSIYDKAIKMFNIKKNKVVENLENNVEHDIDNIVDSYLETAFWTDQEQIEEKGDDVSSADFSEETKEKAKEDIISFMKKTEQYLKDIPDNLIGHNFWLTRNHHGAGFWDMKELDDEIGEIVSNICHEFPEKYVFLGDDGKLYIE